MINFTVNGHQHMRGAEPDTPLLFVLCNTIGLTGTEYGCGIGQWGACTMLLDGKASRSRQMPVERGGAQGITAIETIEADPVGARRASEPVRNLPRRGFSRVASGALPLAATRLSGA